MDEILETLGVFLGIGAVLFAVAILLGYMKRRRVLQMLRRKYGLNPQKSDGPPWLCLDKKARKLALVQSHPGIGEVVEVFDFDDVESSEVVVRTAQTRRSTPSIAGAAVGAALYGLPGAVIGSQLKRDSAIVELPDTVVLCLRIKGRTPPVWEQEFWNRSSDKDARCYNRFLKEALEWKDLLDSARPPEK